MLAERAPPAAALVNTPHTERALSRLLHANSHLHGHSRFPNKLLEARGELFRPNEVFRFLAFELQAAYDGRSSPRNAVWSRENGTIFDSPFRSCAAKPDSPPYLDALGKRPYFYRTQHANGLNRRAEIYFRLPQ